MTTRTGGAVGLRARLRMPCLVLLAWVLWPLARAGSVTGPSMEEKLALRMTGPGFVPFTLETQQLLVQSVREVLYSVGPVQLVSYREGYPDPTAPVNITDDYPYVDLRAVAYDMLSDTTAPWQPDVQSLLTFISRFMQLGSWDQSIHSVRLLAWAPVQVDLQTPVMLAPLLVFEVVLALDAADPVAGVSAAQATLVEESVRNATSSMATLINIRSRNTTFINGWEPAELGSQVNGRQLLLLEVTVPTCTNATWGNDTNVATSLNDPPTPECERQRLRGALEVLTASNGAQQAWEAAGMRNLQLAFIRQRPLPQPPANATASSSNTTTPAATASTTAGAPAATTADSAAAVAQVAAQKKWVPWHLDRLDQRNLPLDGAFTANATGTGVHIYLISTGIRATHAEFGYLSGRPGNRIQPGWGYKGLNPLEDCGDSFAWYGFGTYAASIIGGKTLGVAKNATIHSVRFRGSCLIDDVGTLTPEGLPAAIASVVANHTKPAVMVIDSWWSPNRVRYDDDDAMQKAFKAALDAAGAANITVVAGAGPSPCENVIATHPAVISVGSVDANDEGYNGADCSASCVDFWGPAGSLGTSMTGAQPTGDYDYRAILPMSDGGGYLTAGVAAQYLSMYPEATPAEVLEVLRSMATSDIVTGVKCSPALLYTNFTSNEPGFEPVIVPPPNNGSGNGGGQPAQQSGGGSSAPVAAIVAAVAAVAVVAAVVGFVLFRRRRRQQGSDSLGVAPSSKFSDRALLAGAEWEISADQIEICKRPDGRDWLLGDGSYGQVFKAVKGGVQEVAVKKLHGQYMSGPQRERFVQEIMLLKFVSRDANVMQFYGACVEPTLMLVVELMEGGDLRAALTADRIGELGWYKGGKAIALDILRGLVFLHDSHVIHRDIKSKNILLTREGRAKISDVGLATVLEGEEYRPEGVMGTFAWAAPELLLGDEHTEKADIYSYGVVLWEIATQQVPLRGALSDPCIPDECPQEVLDAIHACMKSDPTQRPTARELYNKLLKVPPISDYRRASLPASSPAPSHISTPPGSYHPGAGMGSARSSEGGYRSQHPLTVMAAKAGHTWLFGSGGGSFSSRWSWGSANRSSAVGGGKAAPAAGTPTAPTEGVATPRGVGKPAAAGSSFDTAYGPSRLGSANSADSGASRDALLHNPFSNGGPKFGSASSAASGGYVPREPMANPFAVAKAASAGAGSGAAAANGGAAPQPAQRDPMHNPFAAANKSGPQQQQQQQQQQQAAPAASPFSMQQFGSGGSAASAGSRRDLLMRNPWAAAAGKSK